MRGDYLSKLDKIKLLNTKIKLLQQFLAHPTAKGRKVVVHLTLRPFAARRASSNGN
ncbi:MAG: hypothetical protein KAY96_02360 [Bacteroidia bacterium]|nr:hypothetical protein [Bacteroidia bacterium]MBP8073575.1 hypothetical protein [Bacteroidia bacterium]